MWNDSSEADEETCAFDPHEEIFHLHEQYIEHLNRMRRIFQSALIEELRRDSKHSNVGFIEELQSSTIAPFSRREFEKWWEALDEEEKCEWLSTFTSSVDN